MSRTDYSETSFEEMFWGKVAIKGSGECWEWEGYKMPNGYGQFKKTICPESWVHRIAYLLMNGPIPDGLQVDHLCRNRLCVNPEHLEAVTRAENRRRGAGMGGVLYRPTHCRRGHPMEGDNAYSPKPGWFICRTCVRRHKKNLKDRSEGRPCERCEGSLGSNSNRPSKQHHRFCPSCKHEIARERTAEWLAQRRAGLGNREIAESAGVTIAAVESNLQRSMVARFPSLEWLPAPHAAKWMAVS